LKTLFLKALQKQASIKKLVQKKVDLILENPVAFSEPLKAKWQGFYSFRVKRNFRYHLSLLRSLPKERRR